MKPTQHILEQEDIGRHGLEKKLLWPDALDIECAMYAHFDVRKHIMVPNITNAMALLAFETDLLVINKSGYATGIEIKVSLSDLKADFKKRQYTEFDKVHPYTCKKGFERFYSKFKYFCYAVPCQLEKAALQHVREEFGIYSYSLYEYPVLPDLRLVRKPQKLSGYKWEGDQLFEVMRLGLMRLPALKFAVRASKYYTKTKKPA